MATAIVKPQSSMGLIGGAKIADWVIPIAAVSLVFVMLVPLPSFLLDLLLAISITASVLVLMAAIHILRPVQFSVFPSLLLLLTMFRLSLNLASSRRILLHGNEGSAAAGSVIEAFGQFVVGGNYVVGFVLFIALIAIQFMVVSHGAVRTAEVTARFTLDAMPGKQMAIDADLNAGIIDEKKARQRREDVGREAEFYGAMDGAARFNQRDALATILITVVNILAGFLIGVFQLNIPFADALKTYTILTVGDGLVTMIPSLLVSISGGIVVTRASSENTLGSDLGKQLLSKQRPLWISAGALVVLALIPGMPKFTFGLIAAGLLLLAKKIGPEKAEQERNEASAKAAGAAGAGGASTTDALDSLLKLDELSLEVGYGLVPVVDAKQGGQLLARVRSVRKHLATSLGFIVPAVHIKDNMRLKQREYVILLRGIEVARWEMHDNCLLAISSDPAAGSIEGVETKEPSFGVPAKWIAPSLQAQALARGYAVVDQTTVMATHLSEIIKEHSSELLTRQETKRLLDRIGEVSPKLLEELVPKLLTLGEIQRVLQHLLREQVSIRDLGTILETLVEAAAVSKQPVYLVECARQALGRGLIRPLLAEDGQLKVVTIDPSIEEELNRAFNSQSAPSSSVALQPTLLRRILEGLRKLLGDRPEIATPVVLCNTPARFHLRRMLEPFLPKVAVVSPGEIPPTISVQSIGTLR